MSNIAYPKTISRVIVLGHTGFIGRYLFTKFQQNSQGIELIGFSTSTLDLTRWDAVQSLNSKFDSQTAVIMCSAIKRHKEDSLEAFQKNIQMVLNIARLLRERPVGRFLYFSSVSVYGEDRNDLHITEETSVNPVTYYGIAKYGAECLLRKAAQEIEEMSLVSIRPSLVYGPGDESEQYRPSGFVKSILAEKYVTLWGDGEEYRDFVFVKDVAELSYRMTFYNCSGTYNIVKGQSYTFREAMDILSRLSPQKFDIHYQPRTRLKVNQGFENNKLLNLFPNFIYTGLEEGIKETFRIALAEHENN